MRIWEELSSTDSVAGVTEAAGVAAVDARELTAHAPDRHVMLLDERRTLLARCSCWWRRVPRVPGHRIGVIGHYAAADAGVGIALVTDACRRLRDAGCTLAIGPMDGNTWRRYRFVVDRGVEPPFLFEPHHPGDWPRHFTTAGFAELATYSSAVNDDLSGEDPTIDATAARLASHGITIRTLDRADLDVELHRIFMLSLSSFCRNAFFTPIDEPEFLTQYRSVLPLVRPELVWLAERERDLVGFLFALPDVLQPRGGAADAMIVKTVAVAPEMAGVGIGGLLVSLVHREAHRLGFRRAIHALMHENNVSSQNISRRRARTIRRYALFGKRLAPEMRLA